MKKLNMHIFAGGILACATMVSFAGDPAPIVPPAQSGGLVGSIGITLGNTWLTGDQIDRNEADEYASAVVDLRLGMDIGSSYYGQFDVVGEFTDVDNVNDSFDYGWGVAAHFMRKSDCCSIGIFGGWFEADFDNDSTSTAERYVVGVEGLITTAVDLHWQVGGIFGNGGSETNRDSLRDAGFARVVASKALDSGWSLSGEVSTVLGVMDSDRGDLMIYGWGIAAQKELTPDWVLAIVYQGNYYEHEDSSTDTDYLTEHFFGVSMTYQFGAGSSDSTSLSLPPVLRWMAITGGVME